MRPAVVTILLAGAALAGSPAWAQESASFSLTEYALNAGGRPLDGSFAQSPRFQLRLDTAGGGLRAATAASTSYQLAAGFVSFNPPPGEVGGVRWTSRSTLAWNGEPSAGTYSVYRDPVAVLPSSSGSCWSTGIPGTTANDAAAPGPGAAWFYLVSVRSRLGESGPLGRRSDGSDRPAGGPCP